MSVRDAILSASSDKRITADEWKNLIQPQADKAPLEASADAREVVKLWANDAFTVDAEARTGMKNFLTARGYDVPSSRPAGSAAELEQAILDTNVSETDTGFQALADKAGKGKAEVSIAILDDGFDLSHQALDTKLYTNPGEVEGDGKDNDGNGKIDDVHGWDFVDGDNNPNSTGSGGHGTHVTGIATRGSDNINAMDVRVYSPLDGKKVADAIDYAAKQGARVMNMSFRIDDKAELTAIVDAMKRHPEVLFVKSAGNDGKDLNSYNAATYLARQSLPNFVVAAAADADGKRASYSNYGTPFAIVGARGTDVMSTLPGGKFEEMSGTSMASPNVVNTASKMLILDPRLSPDQVKGMLADTVDRREDWTKLTTAGGLVNPARAERLAALTGLVRGGMTASAAADRLELFGADRTQLLPLVSKYAGA